MAAAAPPMPPPMNKLMKNKSKNYDCYKKQNSDGSVTYGFVVRRYMYPPAVAPAAAAAAAPAPVGESQFAQNLAAALAALPLGGAGGEQEQQHERAVFVYHNPATGMNQADHVKMAKLEIAEDRDKCAHIPHQDRLSLYNEGGGRRRRTTRRRRTQRRKSRKSRK